MKRGDTSEVKLIDFGIAQKFNEADDSGTLKYMAPEVLSGEHTNTCPGNDVWSMGVLIYKLLTARYPFNAMDIDGIKKGILEDEPNLQAIPYNTQEILGAMLDKHRATRISMEELMEEEWLFPEKKSARIHRNKLNDLKAIKKIFKRFDIDFQESYLELVLEHGRKCEDIMVNLEPLIISIKRSLVVLSALAPKPRCRF